MSLDTICLPCSKSDLFINKFDYFIQKRIKEPKNALNGHESIGCVITDSKMSYVLFRWYKSVWS